MTVTMKKMKQDPLHLQLQDRPDTMSVPLTLASLPADILNVVLERIVRDHHRPGADLVSLALTCSALAQVAIPALYETLVVPTLASLPLLNRTLTARADLADQVKTLALGHAFLDGTQFDLAAGLSNAIKSVEDIGVANDERMSMIGPDTSRSLVMAWMTRIAKVCPNLIGVDFARTRSLPSCHVLGFTNLAKIIGPRRGWFKPPLKRDFYLAAVPVYYPANEKKGPRKVKPGLICAINWALRSIDIVPTATSPESLNLSQMQDLVPGGNRELAKWTVGRVDLYEEEWNTMDGAQVMSFVLGIPQDSHVFDLDPRRLAPSATCTVTAVNLASALKIRGNGATRCTSVSIRNPAINDRFLSNNPMQFHMAVKPQYHQFIADLAPLKSSPWTTVTSLTLGTPLFSPLNWLDSLHQLANIATAFPNVTSLSLQPYFPAIADVLLACDPFLRRTSSIGRPLRRLAIVRSHNEPKLPELKRAVQIDNRMIRSQLCMTSASPHHLEQLVLADTGLFGDHKWWQEHPVLIHPGLLHGLKYANIMGAHVAIAPPRLATPDSESFPSVLSLRRKEKPILLAHVTLPNLLALALNGDLERPSTAISLTEALPTCPNLESLMVDMDWSVCLNTWGEPASVICKYPRLRNVCLACVTFNKKQLELLADHLFAHPIRDLRPVPTLARLILANQSHSDELNGLWVAGPEVGAVWMSDVKVPGAFKVVSPCPFLRLFKNPAMVQPAPLYGELCLCGGKVMGRAGAWMHPLDGTVVCAQCKSEVGVKVESKASGVVVRRLAQDMSNYPSFLYEGPWPLAVV